MNANLYDFHLVGARFNRLALDESAIDSAENDELDVTFKRRGPEISDSTYGDRKIVEIFVRITITPSGRPDITIVDFECAAGFIGSDKSRDGDLELFLESLDFYTRGTYWMLRSRLQTLLSTTRVSVSSLPWDFAGKLPDAAMARESIEQAIPAAKPKKRVKKTT